MLCYKIYAFFIYLAFEIYRIKSLFLYFTYKCLEFL